MLRGAFESAGELTPEELRAEYDELLVDTIETVGIETVAANSDVDVETLESLQNGESPELTLEETAAILAADPDRPEQESILAESRDILLMGMSMAVLDVEAIAAGINDELEPKEIQQKVEGRYPVSLDEYATLHQYIESEKQ